MRIGKCLLLCLLDAGRENITEVLRDRGTSDFL